MIKRLMTALAVVGAAFAGFASVAKAEFPEKDITFLIPFSPGGGMDSTSRAIAQVMGKYLPNNVNVVPKNVPGAGGKRGYGELARSAPDGYTISVINWPGAALPAVLDEPASYDVNTLTWLGRMSVSEYLLGAGPQSGIKTLDDLKNRDKPVKITSTGPGSTAHVGASMSMSVVGFEGEFLTGYKGSAQYILGIVRGDGDIAVAPVQTFAKFVEAGDVVPVVTFEEKSTFDGVPTIVEAGYPELSGLGVERYVAGPPGIPEDIRNVLSEAIQKAIQDPETQAWAEKTNRPFAPLNADEADKAVKRSLATMIKYKDALK